MVIFFIELLVFNYLLVAMVTGGHRYYIIKKYRYDYYGKNPISVFQKLTHNISYGMTSLLPVGVAIMLTILEFLLLSEFGLDVLMRKLTL